MYTVEQGKDGRWNVWKVQDAGRVFVAWFVNQSLAEDCRKLMEAAAAKRAKLGGVVVQERG